MVDSLVVGVVCCCTTGAGCGAGCDDAELLCQMARPETAVTNAAAPVRTPGKEVQNDPRPS